MNDICDRCNKPKNIRLDVFRKWFMQKRGTPFIPLVVFLEDYCQCENNE